MRVHRLLPLFLIAGSGACQEPREPPPAAAPVAERPAETHPERTPPAAEAISLAGAWRVAAIDDRSVDEPHALALVGDLDKLWWEPRCAGMARGYRISGSSIAFASLLPPAPPGSPTPPVCAIGLPPQLQNVFRALDSATSVTRTAENGIRIAGGGHSVTLFSQ